MSEVEEYRYYSLCPECLTIHKDTEHYCEKCGHELHTFRGREILSIYGRGVER